MTTIAHTVTARKPFDCHGYPCGTVVQPGEEYVRHVAFPWDDEVNQSPNIWVLKVCQSCATQYGQPMPPRRSKREVTP